MPTSARYLRAQAALYPVESQDADRVIMDALAALQGMELATEVGPISTELRGSADAVWQGLRTLFDSAAARGGEVALVVTVTNGQP